MGSCHRSALLVIGILGVSACAESGEGMVMNPGTGISGAGGTGIQPRAGTTAAGTGGTIAQPPPAGTSAPVAGMGVGTAGMMAGTGGTPAGPDQPEAGTNGTSGTGGGASGTGGGTSGMGGTAGMGGGAGSCLDGITDFGAAGPFDYEAAHQGAVKIWVPAVPAGCKVPIVHLANGTGASCSAYQNVLNSLASHGFLTTCYENTNTGAGTQGVMAIETVIMNHGAMADTKIGSTGHSQGGQAAFTVLQQAEAKWGDSYTYAGLAMQPASGFGSQPRIRWQEMYGMIKSPMFMFSGTADVLVSQGWVAQGFNALADTVEAYHWSAQGSTHIPTPQAETIQVAIPWFRWKLLGDNEACKAFKMLGMTASDWRVVDEQNPASCQ